MEESEKFTKGKDVSLKTKAKIIYTLGPQLLWMGAKNLVHLKYGVGGELHGYKWAPEQIKPGTSLEANTTKLKLSCFRHSTRRRDFLYFFIFIFGKHNNRRQEEKRKSTYETD